MIFGVLLRGRTGAERIRRMANPHRSVTLPETKRTTTQYNPSGADAPAPFTQGSLLKRSLLGDNNGLLKTDAAAMTRTEPETDKRAPLCKGSSRTAGEGLYPVLVRRPQGRERGKNTNIYEEPLFFKQDQNNALTIALMIVLKKPILSTLVESIG